jgi:clan AA aspartic protease (TIGR02281 family)
MQFPQMINPKIIFVALVTFSLSGCSGCLPNKSDTEYLDPPEDPVYEDPETVIDDGSIRVPYTEQYGNTITIPVKINGMALDMIFDTGASTTMITLAEAKYLYDKDSLSKKDFVDYQPFQAANGEIFVGLRIILRTVVIGDQITLHNIEAVVVGNQKAPLLLGQSIMKEFREVSMDRENEVVKFFK